MFRKTTSYLKYIGRKTIKSMKTTSNSKPDNYHFKERT